MLSAQQEQHLPIEYGLALQDVSKNSPDAVPAIRDILDAVNEVTAATPSRFGKGGFDLSYIRFPLSSVSNGSVASPENNPDSPTPKRLVLFMAGMGLPNRRLRETTLASTYNLVFDEIAHAKNTAADGKPNRETEILIVGSTTNEEAEVPLDLPEMLWEEKFSVHGQQIGQLATNILQPMEEARANTEIEIVTFSMAGFKGREGANEIASLFPDMEGHIRLRYINPPLPGRQPGEKSPFLALKTYLVSGGFIGDTIIQKTISGLRRETARTRSFLSEFPYMPDRHILRSNSQFWTKLLGNFADGVNVFRDGSLLQPQSQRFPTTVEFGTRDPVSTSRRMRKEARESGSFENEGVVFKARPGGHKDQPRVKEWLDALSYVA